MTIAISGTRRELTDRQKEFIRWELTKYRGLVLNVGDFPTGVDAWVREIWPMEMLNVMTSFWGIKDLLKDCSVLVAFPAPDWKGTIDDINQALNRRMEIHVYPLEE